MENLGIMCVVYVSEDTQQLAVYVFRGRWKRWGEITTCVGGSDKCPWIKESTVGVPDFVGNVFSSSSRFCTQVIT